VLTLTLALTHTPRPRPRPPPGALPRAQAYKWFRHLPGYKILGSSPSYEEDLASAKFCLAPAGAGWGKRNVLAAIMGCVPVVISDGIYQPFEPQLNWTSFGLRVKEADMERLPQILDAVSQEALRAMQVAGCGGGRGGCVC
jgi:hypothetical protein